MERVERSTGAAWDRRGGRREGRGKRKNFSDSNLIPARKHDKAKHLSFSQPALF